jgi:hypothetical protein
MTRDGGATQTATAQMMNPPHLQYVGLLQDELALLKGDMAVMGDGKRKQSSHW